MRRVPQSFERSVTGTQVTAVMKLEVCMLQGGTVSSLGRSCTSDGSSQRLCWTIAQLCRAMLIGKARKQQIYV